MVSVLDDIDVRPADDGVVMDGGHDLFLAWADLAQAVAGLDPVSEEGRTALARWLRAARTLADLHPDELVGRLRPLALTPDHRLHPGAVWARTEVPGGLLHLGFALAGLDPSDPDLLTVAPRGLLEATGLDLLAAWAEQIGYLERMGHVAALRLMRDPEAPLRPMGDCDVLTLLGSRTLRAQLADADGVGMRGVAVPMRSRGWTDPDHVDSAFARAAAAATDDDQRGLQGAVLVTRDGIYSSIDGAIASDFTLREVKQGRRRRADDALRPVRYRST
jgi:hypothetical protein